MALEQYQAIFACARLLLFTCFLILGYGGGKDFHSPFAQWMGRKGQDLDLNINFTWRSKLKEIVTALPTVSGETFAMFTGRPTPLPDYKFKPTSKEIVGSF